MSHRPLSERERQDIREAICFALMEQPPNVEEERVMGELVARKVFLDLACDPRLAGWPAHAVAEVLAELDHPYLSAVAKRPVARLWAQPTTVVI